MKKLAISPRPWVEALAALVLLVSTVSFALSILDSQASYSDDRAGLMALKETWGVAAGSFGIRGDARSVSVDFYAQYRAFRTRPSIVHLVKVDRAFSLAADRMDLAMANLENAESLGGTATVARAVKAAVSLDEALAAMAARVADYSRERLGVARVWLAVLIFLVVLVAAVIVFLERRIMLESVEVAGNRALARALISAQEEERLRISHELHDAVAQDLAAARLYCDLSMVHPAGPEAACETGDARKAVDLIERAIGEIREICQGLRPVELDRLGISEACAQLCAETAKVSGLQVDFRASGFEVFVGRELAVFGKELEINLYRILQEALTNVRRHARASRVEVFLKAGASGIMLSVTDDGVGASPGRMGLGLRGMEERARMLGGVFSLEHATKGGTVVGALIPLPEREEP